MKQYPCNGNSDFKLKQFNIVVNLIPLFNLLKTYFLENSLSNVFLWILGVSLVFVDHSLLDSMITYLIEVL